MSGVESDPNGPPRVSIVIPHRNGTDLIDECLRSLEAQTFRDFEVVVVDNGSSDGSVEFVRSKFPWATVLDLGENRGFAGGCNEGMRAAKGELIVLLNNDTRTEPRWLAELVEAMDQNPQAGLGASKVLLADPPHLIDSAGDSYSVKTGTPANIGAGEPADSYSDPAWVFGASAAASIYRRAMLDEIGMFDEDFFYILEDVDLDFRAQLAGYRCIYSPAAVVYHKRGVSLRDRSPEVRAIILRNLIWVAGKNLPAGLLAECAARAIGRSVRWMGWRAKRRLSGHRDHPPGHFGRGAHAKAILRAIVTIPRKRRETQRLRRVSAAHIRAVLERPRVPLG